VTPAAISHQIKARERPETVDVTIGATTAFSSLWLTPKISAFWKIHPSITVSQVVSDVPGMTSRCDLTIHYGNPQENGVECKSRGNPPPDSEMMPPPSESIWRGCSAGVKFLPST